QLVWAALVLCQAWLAAGRPEGVRSLGMFDHWAKVMGGVLDIAGVPGFLGNLDNLYEDADEETSTWTAFMAAWWSAHGNSDVKASECWPQALEAGLDLGDKGEHSQKVRLGNLLRKARGRVFCLGKLNLRLEATGDFRRAKLWRIC